MWDIICIVHMGEDGCTIASVIKETIKGTSYIFFHQNCIEISHSSRPHENTILITHYGLLLVSSMGMVSYDKAGGRKTLALHMTFLSIC